MNPAPLIPANRILVVMPAWLGDGVMATPFLRALRSLYPAAHIAALHPPLLDAVVAGLPELNAAIPYTKSRTAEAVRTLRANAYDLAILLPNSFRSALMLFRAGIPHRVGYARELRSLLLTHALHPRRRSAADRAADAARTAAIRDAGGSATVGTPFAPVPTIDYYLAIAARLGATDLSPHMHLAVTPAERDEALATLTRLAILPTEPLAILVPGANFGSSKCYPPDRFAAVAAALTDPHGPYRARVLIASSPKERPIVDAILAALPPDRQHAVIALAHFNGNRGISLGALKEIIRRSRLMVCNDTGPRHIAAAFNIPTVTLFGPTDPRWAHTYHTRERIVSAAVPCSPCQLKRCPIDHRCMTTLPAAQVMNAIAEIYAPTPPTTGHRTLDTGHSTP